MQLLANRIITPDGTMLQSMNRHDFVGHKDAISKEIYFTDGGLSYVRRSVNKVEAVSADVFTTDPHEKIREAMHWGTLGKNGDEELRYVAVKDLTTDHVEAILATQNHIPSYIREVLVNEIKYRNQ